MFRSIYIGNFEKGIKSGEGTEYTKYGIYAGQWSVGMKNGKGLMKYKVGSQYNGQWKNNFQ